MLLAGFEASKQAPTHALARAATEIGSFIWDFA